MPATDLRCTAAWTALQDHYAHARDWRMRDLFDADPQRFHALSEEAAGVFLDYSKNRITRDTMDLLCALARERSVEEQRAAMFAGDGINHTEQRAVLHTALRAPRGERLVLDGQDINAEVHAVLDRLGHCAGRVRSGDWTGYTGQAITDVVNIGIGGSYLGPKMVCEALRSVADPRIAMHFVSNVDGHDLAALLARVRPETTLFIIASKTFTTQETMMNAQSARTWFLQSGEEADLARHFVAVSTNTKAVTDFGIDPANMFGFWDWVGGRYSVWSAIGLPVAIAVGPDAFREFLAGAHGMDQHFCSAPLERNLPAILALVGIWNRNFLGCTSISIAPYHQDLASFPGYLEQLDMESNGKGVDRDGTPVSIATSPVIWGDTGTNGQHAYFQMLHQGTDPVPVDFIAVLQASHALPGHQEALLANCFAQSEALMRGKTEQEVGAELQAQGLAPDRIAALVPHRTFPGNRPSNTLLLQALTPASLGALIALYEHKVFVQGVIWGVNSFDQWGVELGKVLARAIQNELMTAPDVDAHDASTNGLIARARMALQPNLPGNPESMALTDFDFVLFGGGGDLAMRKLIPALYALSRGKGFPQGSRIIAVGRHEWRREDYLDELNKQARPNIEKDRLDEAAWNAFCERVDYVSMNASDAGAYQPLKDALRDDDKLTRVYYLAMPPNLFAGICQNLAQAGLATPNARVVLEKPLGRDVESARQINADVGQVFAESQIFRIDHYLGKEAVQNLLALRFGNILFEPLWRREWISDVQITIAEELGVGNRMGYYETSGALRDMLQNHLLQLLCIVAMEPPVDGTPDAVRDEKLKVLRALKRFTPNSLVQNVVRGQYKSGHVNGVAVPGYRKEPDANTQSRTETFVAVKAEIDTWRWSGVPFYLRTGKRMADQLAEIVVRFKSIPHSIFNQPISSFQPNSLVIRLQPDEGLNLNLMAKTPGDGMRLKLVDLELDFRETFKKPRMEAYERLLMDVLRGQLTLFMRSDELEAAWEWVEPILHFWDQEDNDPLFYTAGSWGPGAASALIGRDGLQWREEALPEE